VSERSERGLGERLDRWLDYAFFGGAEVTVLGLPALLLLLAAPDPVAVSLSAMTALAVSTVTVATLRGGWVDVGEWPAFGDFASLPVRAAYYGGVLGLAAYLGAASQALSGSALTGVWVPALLCVALLAAFPRFLASLASLARTESPLS
jgi:hypothetical protein